VTGLAELDVERMLEALVAHEVDFVLVGAVAVAYHGFVRATQDVDIVPNPREAELRKLWKALTTLDAQPLALHDFRPEELPAPFTLESLLGLASWDLTTKHGRLDILQYVEGALEGEADYARLRDRAEPLGYPFGRVWIVGYDDLVDLKTIAGRDQDLVDIRALREARGETGAY
jgi:hypothetical protein